MNVKEESENIGLKLNIQKMKVMASGHHFMADRCRNSGNSVRLYILGAPKSLQMAIAAMKFKDAYSLKENYDQPRICNVSEYSKAETLLCQQKSI